MVELIAATAQCGGTKCDDRNHWQERVCTYRALAEILLGLLERHLEIVGEAEMPIKT